MKLTMVFPGQESLTKPSSIQVEDLQDDDNNDGELK